MKILGLLGQYPPDELERRQTAMRRAAPPDVQLEFAYLDGSVFRPGLTNLHRALIAPVVARAVKQAADDGFDAVVPYGTLDLGVEESRHVADIPVIGPGRTVANFASMLCERFVVLCYDQAHVVMQSNLLRAWRVDSYVTSIRHVSIEIVAMQAEAERLHERFVHVARESVEREGAQLVVPMGMTMVPVMMSAAALSADVGVPVLDPLALSLHAAAGLARSGFRNSRVLYPPTTADG